MPPSPPMRLIRLLARADMLLCLVVAVALLAVATTARAELVIDVRRGAFQPIPIAIADFGGEPSLGPQVGGIIANNLKRSGYFIPLDKGRDRKSTRLNSSHT